MPIPPLPFPFRRRNIGPEFYRMSCPACGFEREYELARNYEVVRNPDCDRADDPEIVEELPERCPKCGAPLKKEKIPVRIYR